MAHYIGLDLGGTNIKAGVVDEFGRPLARASVPTRADEGPDTVMNALAEAARTVARKADLTLRSIAAIGVGAPGPIDFDAGVVLAAPNLPGWTNVPLRQRISDLTHRPTVIENDANAAAMGEFWAGAAQDPRITNLIMLTLGTGIGSGIVVDGRIVHGGFGYGGEVGHMIINPDGPRHTSGSPGCFEYYASAAATGRRAAEMIASGNASSLKAVLDADGQITAEDVFAAAKDGDTLAQGVVEEVTRTLGLVCVNLCRLFDPQMIVFAGGMTLAGDYLFDRIRQWYKHFNWTILESKVQIVPAMLGNDAGLIGAAAVAWDAHQAGKL